jgi:23S rRNA (adenine2503-C2)-methyltransferase
MTNLSKKSRHKLKDHFSLPHLTLHSLQTSRDGTVKFTLQAPDGHILESVLIPSGSRSTACISSQIGCQLSCTFCATGKIPFKRNLTPAEIYDQIVIIGGKSQELYNRPLSNVVFMGMGEPLLNDEAVTTSIDLIASEKSLGFSPRRVTLSTIGIPDKIRKLADNQAKFELAVSLHAARDKIRTRLVPVNTKYNLESLKMALREFHAKTKKRITFEYLLLNDINDSLEDAGALAEYCRNFPVKINLIEYHETGIASFQKSAREKRDQFKAFLESKNMVVHIRKSRGEDIDAACGQLSGKPKHS